MENKKITETVNDEQITPEAKNTFAPVGQSHEGKLFARSNRYDSFLMMPDIYRVPGSADDVLRSLTDDTDRDVFEAQLAYHRGDIKLSLKLCNKLLARAKSCDLITSVGAYLLTAALAMYSGDLQLWSGARFGLASLKGKDETERDYISFSHAIANTGLLDINTLPDWFKSGSFGNLYPEIYPAARVAYAMYLTSLCYRVMKESGESSSPYDIHHTFVMTCEQMISQTAAEGVIAAEIPLRLLCAVGYHNIGQDKTASKHIDRVIELALPDRLYSALAEYYTNLDFLLDERLGAVDKNAQRQVREMSQRFKTGWMSLYNAIYNQTAYEGFTVREREVAKFAAFGLTNREIANQLHVSIATVKQALQGAMEKTGTNNRTELFKYI